MKQYLLSAGIAAVVVIVALLAWPPVTKIINNPTVGATPGADRFNSCETRNGIAQCFTKTGLLVGTTTSCAIKTPSATSTLLDFSVVTRSGNQVATIVTLTTGTAMQASTTALGGIFGLAANAQGLFQASTTNTETSRQLNPNTWIQANFQGGSGTASTTGTCQATFEIL